MAAFRAFERCDGTDIATEDVMVRSRAARFTVGIFFLGCWGDSEPPPGTSDAVLGDRRDGRQVPGENEGGDGFGGVYFGGGMPQSGGGPQIGDGPGVPDKPGIGDQPGQTGGGPGNGGGYGQDTSNRGHAQGAGGAGGDGILSGGDTGAGGGGVVIVVN